MARGKSEDHELQEAGLRTNPLLSIVYNDNPHPDQKRKGPFICQYCNHPFWRDKIKTDKPPKFGNPQCANKGMKRSPAANKFPKESHQEVINMYLLKGLSAPQIGENFDVSETTIRKVLEENNIQRRSRKDATLLRLGGSQLRKTFIPSYALLWRKQHQEGSTIGAIAINYNTNKDTVSRILKQAGFSVQRRQHIINEKSFNGITKTNAYWLGILMTDGNISCSENRLTLGLQPRDRGHLENFKDFLQFKGSVQEYIINGRRDCRLIIHSKQIIEDLSSYGILPQKSLNGKVKKSFLVYSPDFWRGAIDGDGSIRLPTLRSNGKHSGTLNITLHSASLDFTTQFQDFLAHNNIQFVSHSSQRENRNTMYGISATSLNAFKLIKLLGYERDDLPSLERKKRRALFILNNVTSGSTQLIKKENYFSNLKDLLDNEKAPNS